MGVGPLIIHYFESQAYPSGIVIHGKKDEQDRVLKHDFRALRCMREDADNYLGAFLFGFLPYKDGDFLKQGDLVPFDKGQNYQDCLEDIEAAKKICERLQKDYECLGMTVGMCGGHLNFAKILREF